MRLTATKPVAALRLAASARVDAEAEAARLQFLTGGAGQALEYQATEAEARALLMAGGTPDPADYPFVQAEVAAILAATGVVVTIESAAAAVVVEADGWKAVGSAIKELRRSAKMRIEAAASPAAIEAAATGIPWPVP